MSNYVSEKITQDQKEKIISYYLDYKTDAKGDYLIFAAKKKRLTVQMYESKKGSITVTFLGEDAVKEARKFIPNAEIKQTRKTAETCFLDYSPQIGSDEVGTGDLFGPIVVTACYFDEEVEKNMTDFKIDDSKKLTDDLIEEIIPKIINKLTFSKYTLMPEKYNALLLKGYNMNAIKAVLHNLALLSLKRKVKANKIYVDEFCSEELFYKYLQNEKEVIKGVTFKTKGESSFPSVALGSMISRYSFLQSMQELEREYKMTFPKGAGTKSNEALQLFINKYGKEELHKVAKLNFKNLNY